MSALAAFQDWPDQNVGWFNKDQERVIADFKIPGDGKLGSGGWGSRATYYPRKPIENPNAWFANHAAKLASLERAEGLR